MNGAAILADATERRAEMMERLAEIDNGRRYGESWNGGETVDVTEKFRSRFQHDLELAERTLAILKTLAA
jgi:hypothetical protein